MKKQCNKCLEFRLLEFFQKQKDCKGGYRSICKKCDAIKKKLYYKNNKEYFNEKAKDYYKNNKKLVTYSLCGR